MGLEVFLAYPYFSKLAPIKDQNQLLSDTLLLIGEYLKIRAKLLTKKTKRDEHLKKLLVQHQINEKQETLRETLLTARKRSGRSHYEEKQLLILTLLLISSN
jgi:hypothetical protein